MKEYLRKLPPEVQDLIYLASDTASKNNMPAYLVGGFVRDLILGVKNFDLDIVVEGDGIKFAQGLANRFRAKLVCHKRFATATITLKPRQKIDISTARKEFYPAPASLPVVSSGHLKDDLFRRDFTINAMAISIGRQDFGRLIDLFAGNTDLHDKKIRILHDLSFIDDPTRILRAVRFEQRYNFKIEPKTLALLKEAVKNMMLEKVQPQRLRDDLILILKEEDPLREIKRLKELAGFSFIDKDLLLSKSTWEFLSSIDRQIKWFNKNYPQRRLLDIWLIYLIGLTDSLNARHIKSICKRFALRKGEEKRILSYKNLRPKYICELGKSKIKPSRIFSLLEPLSYEVILMLKAKYKNKNIQRHIADFFEIYNGMRIQICGDDLHRLGVSPGPYYQNIFSSVLKAKLEGLVKTREDELALIKKLIKSK